MSEESPADAQPTDVPSYVTPVSERPPDQEPTRLERSVERLRDLRADGSLATLGGLVAIGLAIKHALGGRGRALLYGAAGVALVRRGRRQRGESAARAVDAGFEAAEPAVDQDHERVAFTEEAAEPRPKSDLDAAGDPRRSRSSDVVEIDISEDAVADEPGEATGPDPEQAQPTQTEVTEPEADPERAEPGEDVEAAGTAEDDADADAENEADVDADNQADSDAGDDTEDE